MFVGVASAANTDGSFTSWGPGTKHSCRAWLNTESGSPLDIRNQNWLGGFVTAYNAKMDGVTDILNGDNDLLDRFVPLVYKQCDAFPTWNVSDAALTIADRLAKKHGVYNKDDDQ